MQRIAFLLTVLFALNAQAAPRPVVLELFTSQGCDSCPPAEKLLTELAKDPTLLPLSYHVDYWDYIGWKDAFSLKASTDRQYAYAELSGKKSVYTPQLIVDGKKPVIGSREKEVKDAIDAAKKNQATPVDLTITKANGKLALHVPDTAEAKLVVVRFKKNATTDVKAGENKGRALSSVNNVTEIQLLEAKDQTVAANTDAETGLAVLLQKADGRILGAATYIGL